MLPKIDTPVYEVTLPISKEKILFRPFLVKEQKILLISSQSDDPEFVNNNIKQTLKNCCISEVNVDKLSSVDIEFFFINLRARSIGEVVETKYRCENLVDGEPCKNLMNVNINLIDIEVDTSNYSDMVKLTDNVGIKMKCPNFDTISIIGNENIDYITKTFDVIKNSIEYIFDDNNFYYPAETSEKELQDFIESLSIEQFKKIEEYFKQIPKVKEEVEIKCSKCGFEHKIVLEGMQSFLE